MKSFERVLEYYGNCCVKEHELSDRNEYPSEKQGEEAVKRDKLQLADIRGQKKAIEWILSP